MKYYLVLFIGIAFLACKNQTKPSTYVISEKVDTIQNEVANVETQSKNDSTDMIESSNEEVEEDCIFDQSTQTDEFLEGIKEFEGYDWNYEDRTATIVLENLDTLIIRRGGCNHFGVSVEFKLRNDSTDFNNISNVYEKVLWAAKLLENELAFEDIKNEIDSSLVTVDTYNNIDHVYFSSDYLRDNNYSIVRKVERGATIIILGYYIN